MEKAFLTDVLEGINVVHAYLSRDLANERLSKSNQQKRYHHIQLLDSLRTKINSTHPSVGPKVTTPGPISHPPPTFKPPPPIPDEPQELYEVPEIKDEAEDYLTFEPSQTDEPQEDYLAMEVEEGRVQEEMYEDPTQTIQDDEQQELYEEPNTDNFNPSIQVSSPSSIQSVPPPHVNSNNQNDTGAGYMDPIKLKDSDKRNSLLPENIQIEDWEEAYEQSFVNKKKEKMKASKLKNVVMKGYLEKLGGKNRNNWQKRYCVLAEMFMYFYEKESSATYNNRIPIPGFVPNPSAELTRPKKNQFAFKLSFTTSVGAVAKDYYFRARTEKERDTWVQSIREIFELGRGMIEKRKSMTLPHTSVSQVPQSTPRPLSDDFEQENYETLVPALESDEEQDEYVDVNTHHIDDDEPQEEYVDLQPTNKEIIEEEPQEDYVEAGEFQTPQRPPLASSQPPLPPPPLQVSRPPQQLQQPVRRPDPHVDTDKTYIKRQNGIQYDRVYVLMWDFNGTDSDELKLNRGDLVLVNEPKVGQEWWYGEQLDQDANIKIGSCGLFPASYSSPAFQLIS